MTVVRERYRALDDETFEPHRLASAIQGSRAVLRGRRDALRTALQWWRRDDKPSTHRALRRYLWESRLSGHISSEIDAHRLLGELYAVSSEPGWAIWHLVQAGQAKEAAAIASGLSQPVDVADASASLAPWVAAAALAVVAAEADLLSDEQVDDLVPRLVEASTGVAQSVLGPQVSLEAMKAIAALAGRLPERWVSTILDFFRPLIAREPGRYRPSDDAMLAVFAGLYRAHPTRRPEVAELFAHCLKEDGLAYSAIKLMYSLVDHSDALVQALLPLAADGNRWALELLARFGDGRSIVLAEAERRVARLLALETKNGANEWTLFAVDTAASLFARYLPEEQQVSLARQWLRLAQDTEDMALNRASALDGLAILVAELPPTVRAELFDPVFGLLDGGKSLSRADAISDSTLHPLNPVRINLSPDSLRQAALRTAAILVIEEEQGRRVETAILQALGIGAEGDVHAAAVALVRIPPQFVTLDLRPLAVHPSIRVRQAAAVLWARHPSALPDVGIALALDANRRVRESIAAQLGVIAETAPSMLATLREILTRDSSAGVRAIAASDRA